jgi:hypothetical protein
MIDICNDISDMCCHSKVPSTAWFISCDEVRDVLMRLENHHHRCLLNTLHLIGHNHDCMQLQSICIEASVRSPPAHLPHMSRFYGTNSGESLTRGDLPPSWFVNKTNGGHSLVKRWRQHSHIRLTVARCAQHMCRVAATLICSREMTGGIHMILSIRIRLLKIKRWYNVKRIIVLIKSWGASDVHNTTASSLGNYNIQWAETQGDKCMHATLAAIP